MCHADSPQQPPFALIAIAFERLRPVFFGPCTPVRTWGTRSEVSGNRIGFGAEIHLATVVLVIRQMLPSSHLEPMNALLADNYSVGQDLERVTKDESAMQARSAVLLASAFTEFISASTRLENSYRQLQEEVSDLRVELSARNAALSTSLAENERMRLDLQQIVDSMPCGVLVLDRKGEISMINPESGRLLGLDGCPKDRKRLCGRFLR